MSAKTTRGWDNEWRDAEAAERVDAAYAARRQRRSATSWLPPAMVLAALLPAIFPLTPGFSEADTLTAVVAAALAAAVAVAVVPVTMAVAAERPGQAVLFTLALLSAGAAAIHFAVAKMHFDEYTLFGVFFVASGTAQLVWAVWLLLRPWRPLFALGAIGNGAIVALWAVDRIWGLPLGPEHWKPEPVGFGDSVTAAFELVLVAGCVILLAHEQRRPLHRGVPTALTLAVMALTALSLLSVLGVGSQFLTPTE